MSIKAECDRCGRRATMTAHLEVENLYRAKLPSDWESVSGTTLCEKCAEALHEFLRPLPYPYRPTAPQQPGPKG